MSQIISIANQKGRVGKSTIAFNLATALADNKHTVFVVDADLQSTVSMWAKARIRHEANKINPNITFTENPWTPEEILKLAQPPDYEFIIINCGPANNKDAKATLVVSDLTIIPISPGPLDINSACSTIDADRRRHQPGSH